MRRVYWISLILLMVWYFTGYVFAKEPQYSNMFLLRVLFKAQALRDQAIEEIRRLDMEIKYNEEVIRESKRLINLASQRTDAEARVAEEIAREAMMKAQEAKRRNEETKRKWELKKINADRSYATINNILSQNIGSNKQIRGFITGYTGNVYIIKANGEKATLENGFLEPGDKVWTADGTAEIQMLDGRATTILGPYSEFVMKKDTPQEQVAELLKGKIYMAVEKIDEYAKRMKEIIEQYKKDLKTITQLNEEDINELKKYIESEKRRLRKEFNILLRPGRRLPEEEPINIGVRGTKFTIEIKDNNTTEVMVFEGTVEISMPEKNKRLSVEAGNKVTIGLDGNIMVEKITQIKRWWENE